MTRMVTCDHSEPSQRRTRTGYLKVSSAKTFQRVLYDSLTVGASADINLKVTHEQEDISADLRG